MVMVMFRRKRWLVVKTLPHSAFLPAQLSPTLVVSFSGRLLLRKMEVMIRMPIREHSLPTTAILVQMALLMFAQVMF